MGVYTDLPMLRDVLNLSWESGQADAKSMRMSVWPDSLVLQARLCGFVVFMATESEWALACGSIVTSYSSRQCLPLGDPVPPCETDPVQGFIPTHQ